MKTNLTVKNEDILSGLFAGDCAAFGIDYNYQNGTTVHTFLEISGEPENIQSLISLQKKRESK